MSLHKLTAGDGYSYLTRHTAAMDATDKGHTGLGEYYSQRGEAPGRWVGAGLAGLDGIEAGQAVTEEHMKALFGEGRHPVTGQPLGRAFYIYGESPTFRTELAKRFAQANLGAGLPSAAPLPEEVRARIRTELGNQMFTTEHGRAPVDARELSGFIAKNSRQATTAVAGYDLTFSPVKSVSALWAVATEGMAMQIEAAHDAAVADTLGWLERHAIYTRTGRDGVRQVDTAGLVATAFTHRDARSGDPDLHTHVAVSNKVQGLDGTWRAIDGRVLFKAAVTASERYNTRLEAELRDRLGVRFTERETPHRVKRVVREVVGVDPRLNQRWSTRRAAIDAHRADLARDFQARHGRPPTVVESIKLAQQATLATRDAKHAPRSLAEQRRQWRAEAATVLGNEHAVARMVSGSVSQTARAGTARNLSRHWVDQTSGRLLRTLEQGRSTWQVWHVESEARRLVRSLDLPLEDVDDVVDKLTSRVLSSEHGVPLHRGDHVTEPPLLRRRDGSSVYQVAGSQLFTSPAITKAEGQLVAWAGKGGGRRVDAQHVEIALLETTANGHRLNASQAHLVRSMATSGARLQLAIAPAGSGKTTAMRALASAWTDSGGNVLGLAPSAVAASELRTQMGAPTDTLAKLTYALRTGTALPEWARTVTRRTLLVIDEAGMAGTTELRDAVAYILGKGGSVRLIGDDQQLASVAAGGVLRDIAHTAGAVTLSELVRFTDQAEGAASLALRAGDPRAAAFYLDNHRVRVGDLSTVTSGAYEAWARDRAAGLESIMLAPTRELVAELNTRARADRLAAQDAAPGPEVALADGLGAGAGDTVLTRRNDRTLRLSGTDWVKNGDRWTVGLVLPDRSVEVVHATTGRHVILPNQYVRESLELGYACTVHGAQGVTVDTCHAVADGQESRQSLYVALTRGRASNVLHLVTAGDGDAHSITRPDAVLPPTATEILTRIIGRDGAQRSAQTLARDAASPSDRLAQAAARYADAVGVCAAAVVGPDALAEVDTVAERAVPGLTGMPAWPTLRAQLALIGAGGHNPQAALLDAIEGRELASAADATAVLDWRLDPTGSRSCGPGPLPWLPAIPSALIDHPQFGTYLTQRATLVQSAAADVAAQAANWTVGEQPTWARHLDGPPAAQLRIDVAVWRAATGVEPLDPTPAGPVPPEAARRRAHHRLTEQLQRSTPASHAALDWAPQAQGLGIRTSTDPHWPALAEQLAALSRSGLDAPALLRAAATEGPLPDDMHAAAITWRLSRHLSPAVLHAATGQDAAPLNPPWATGLPDRFGPDTAERVRSDTAWPALVAAVDRAVGAGWSLEDILRRPAGPDGEPVGESDLCDALIWHTCTLTDSSGWASSGPTQPPPDPTVVENLPPEDMYLLDTRPHPDSPDAHPDPATVLDPRDAAMVAADEIAVNQDLAAAVLGREGRPDWTPSDAEIERQVVRAYEADTAAVTPQRLLEVNSMAADFYASRVAGSWVPAYLQQRLGTDLTGHPHLRVGHAPHGWMTLTDHLRRLNVTDLELATAGLAKTASTGLLIDCFRDRMMLPIATAEGVVGFVGRRNPARDDDPKAGPKYLNTSDTPMFHKSEVLYGLAESSTLLAAGARPVLVEGPLDAIAVTLTGNHVGLAPLGTSLTDHQADQLRRLEQSGVPVLVATDPDLAGRVAAERDFWMLAARGSSPDHVALSDGLDPAATLATRGVAGLRDALASARALAELLIEERASHLRAGQAMSAAAQVLASLPHHHWDSCAYILATLTASDPLEVRRELASAAAAWNRDPRRQMEAQLSMLRAEVKPRLGAAAEFAEPATQRWHQLAASISADLPRDPGWPALAATLDAARRGGVDVHDVLFQLAAQSPLPENVSATDLRYRLLAHLDTWRAEPVAIRGGRRPGHDPLPHPASVAPERSTERGR